VREASQPPRPGVRRPINESTLVRTEDLAEFRARIDTIQKCGLAAEVTVNGSWINLFATRRTRVIKAD
jgi:hypothetical protein